MLLAIKRGVNGEGILLEFPSRSLLLLHRHEGRSQNRTNLQKVPGEERADLGPVPPTGLLSSCTLRAISYPGRILPRMPKPRQRCLAMWFQCPPSQQSLAGQKFARRCGRDRRGLFGFAGRGMLSFVPAQIGAVDTGVYITR